MAARARASAEAFASMSTPASAYRESFKRRDYKWPLAAAPRRGRASGSQPPLAQSPQVPAQVMRQPREEPEPALPLGAIAPRRRDLLHASAAEVRLHRQLDREGESRGALDRRLPEEFAAVR